jgi:hypothetical protein
MSDPTYEPEGVWISGPDDPRLVVLWAAAADYEDDDLAFPLNVARIQCERFAPALPEGTPVPDNYVAGQILQARALVREGVVGSGDQVGGLDAAVTLFPMDWNVKLLLRPRKGRPYFGGGKRRP